MEKLKKINQEYIELKKEATLALNEYVAKSKNNSEGSLNDPHWVHYKSVERKSDKKIEEFVLEVNKYVVSNKILINELIIILIDEIRNNLANSIGLYMLINLICKSGIIVDRDFIEEIEKLILKLTSPQKIDSYSDYYIEMLIDWLNYNTEKPIKIDILEKVLLLEYKNEKKYGSYVKAISYLNSHSDKEIRRIHRKIRKTDKYNTDEYYKDWLNEE